MAYTPKPDREVRGGRAIVSAKEMADFKKMYGEDKTLRDLLNMDKGLERRGDRAQAAAKAAAMREADDARAAARDAMQARGNAMTTANYVPRRAPSSLTETEKPGTRTRYENDEATGETFKRGGKVGSASKRADGIAQRGKTRGTMVMCGGGKY